MKILKKIRASSKPRWQSALSHRSPTRGLCRNQKPAAQTPLTTVSLLTADYRRLMAILLTVSLVLVSVSATVEAASLINVPLNPDLSDFNRETYRFVHRLLNKRVLPGIRRGSLPLTRKQVVSYLLEVTRKQKNGEITLSAIDRKRLNALLTFYREVRAPITQSSDAGYGKCRRGFQPRLKPRTRPETDGYT